MKDKEPVNAEFFYRKRTMDGGFGTLAADRLRPYFIPSSEQLNLTHPETVKSIHADYAARGADIVCTNTFSVNPLKNENYETIIQRAVMLAKQAAPECYIALDVGPTGKLIGDGGLSMDEAIDTFSKIISAGGDAFDFVLIETMTDLSELRAALIASSSLKKPAVCSMSFDENGRTFFGCSIESFAACAHGLGALANGINCSLGAVKMLPLAKRLLKCSRLPVFIKPNAGMPKLVNGQTIFDETPEIFAEAMKKIADAGVPILGGCCGSEPDHIALLSKIERKDFQPNCVAGGILCCGETVLRCGGPMKIIGERINPTGKPPFKQALKNGDYGYALKTALEQKSSGADALDVNVGYNEIDEKKAMVAIVKKLRTAALPLVLDSSDAEVLESALKEYAGKALINSVNGKEETLRAILPLAKKYGAALIGLALDENGIPAGQEERLRIADKILARCKQQGIDVSDVYIDALTLAEASGKGNALTTLGVVKALHEKKIKTVLGVSNISFGMPMREDINAAFLKLAEESGLSLAIVNPARLGLKPSVQAEKFLLGEISAEEYIAFAGSLSAAAEIKKTESAQSMDLKDAIINGLSELSAEKTKERLLNCEPLQLAKEHIIPALDEVGRLYESGSFFLPQLLSAADAAKAAFEIINTAMRGEGICEGKRFVLCTVKGDVHDIGKNIVKTVCSNYGYRVIDLGRDVRKETVLEAVKVNYPCVLGLSALMTTTAKNMAETIAFVRNEFPLLRILVGGAVLTEEYAVSIGGEYCKDVNDTVKILKTIYD